MAWYPGAVGSRICEKLSLSLVHELRHCTVLGAGHPIATAPMATAHVAVRRPASLGPLTDERPALAAGQWGVDSPLKSRRPSI